MNSSYTRYVRPSQSIRLRKILKWIAFRTKNLSWRYECLNFDSFYIYALELRYLFILISIEFNFKFRKRISYAYVAGRYVETELILFPQTIWSVLSTEIQLILTMPIKNGHTRHARPSRWTQLWQMLKRITLWARILILRYILSLRVSKFCFYFLFKSRYKFI